MQAMVVHICDETIFFPWIPYIQMHTMFNISLNILIVTWIYTNNFILKSIVWLFID